MKKWCMSAILVIACLLFAPCASAFSADNGTYVLWQDERIQTSKTYAAVKMIDYFGGSSLSTFKNASDLFLDKDGNLLVADTGNNRIVKLTKEGMLLGTYSCSESPLNAPQGIYEDENGDMYIADTNNSRIVVLDENGKYIREYGKPKSDLLGDMYQFSPTRLAIGSTGYIYFIVGKDFMAIDKNGDFKGYIGAIKLGFTLRNFLVSNFTTSEQKDKIVKETPASYNNFTIDPSGKILACSANKSAQIRMLNSLGDNIYPEAFYGEKSTAKDGKTQTVPQFADIAVDKDGFITLLDSNTGKLYQYDGDGNCITVFGGKGNNKGLFQTPVSLVVDNDGNIYVLDSQRNNIQIFAPTNFLTNIHTATALYSEGNYEQSLELWKDICLVNSNYPLARSSLGKIYYKEKNYAASLENYKLSEDMNGYSKTFSKMRQLFLKDYLGWVILALVPLAVLVIRGWSRLHRYANRVVKVYYFGKGGDS